MSAAPPNSAPAASPTPPPTATSSHDWGHAQSGTALALMALCLMLRLPGLMTLPIFSDESIYLRWAQLIHQSPSKNAWVSLIDPKPPLHFWLMASLWGLASDPLIVGRIISVATAVLMVPALLALCRAMENLFRHVPATPHPAQAAGSRWPLPSGRAVGLLACLLTIICPYLAFNQRLALADAPFAFESVLAAWAALRLAADVWRGGNLRRGFLLYSLPLGIVMGLTMLTRQNLSYVLWGLPVLAFALLARRASGSNLEASHHLARGIGRAAILLAAAAFVAGVLWSPFLLAHPGRYRTAPDAAGKTESRFTEELKRRVLYQTHFIAPLPLEARTALVRDNFTLVFIPSHAAFFPQTHVNPSGPLTSGWYWVYLTPPVFIASLAALIWLAIRGQWRLLAFLLGWLLILIGPIVLMSTVMFSRYALAGVIPLLLALAFMLADIAGGLLSGRLPAPIGWAAAATLIVGLLAWPAYDLHRQVIDPTHQPMVAKDRAQFITGWTAGYGVQDALRFLNQLPPDSPLVLITDDGHGSPSDDVWVYLHNRPNLQLYYIEDAGHKPILRPVASAERPRYLLSMDKWLYTSPQPVELPADAPILYITQDSTERHTTATLQALNPGIETLIDFPNPSDQPGDDDRVVIFRLR